MRIKRVIGNNTVLAYRGDEEVVVLGHGLGFGARKGDLIDESQIERVFLAEDTSDERLSAMLADIPLPFLRVAARIADMAHERLRTKISQALILPLADHLSFAAQRAKDSKPMVYPLRWEVSQLYPAEYQLGQEAVRLASRDLNVPFDPDEAVAIAMHLVNAQFTMQGHTQAMVMTETISLILDVIEQTFDLTLDRHAMDCARFITHLRYLFARVAADKQIIEQHPTLLETITNSQPEAMRCAYKIKFLIERAFGGSLSADETAYIGLHVARLLAASTGR